MIRVGARSTFGIVPAGLAMIAVTYGLARFAYGLFLPELRGAYCWCEPLEPSRNAHRRGWEQLSYSSPPVRYSAPTWLGSSPGRTGYKPRSLSSPA